MMIWDSINIEKYQVLSNINNNDFDSIFEYKKELISIVNDIPYSTIDEMDIDEYEVKENDIQFLFNKPNLINKEILQLEGYTFHFINNYNLLTLQEYIEIEFYLSNDLVGNYHKILPIVYKLKEIKNSPLFPDVFEPYLGYAEHRSSMFLNVNINDVYGAIHSYIKWRENLIEQYKGLFKGVDEGGEDEDLTQEEKANLSPHEIKEVEKQIDKEKKLTKWNMELFLKNLTDNDITKVEPLLKENILFILNWRSADIEVGSN